MTPIEIHEALTSLLYWNVGAFTLFCLWVAWDSKRREKGGAYRRRH